MSLKFIFKKKAAASPRIFSKIPHGYQKKKSKRVLKGFLRIGMLLLISIAFTSIIQLYIIFPLVVNDRSMFPSIEKNSLVFALYPYLTRLQRGNILFIRHKPRRLSLLCRLVALPGEVLEIKQKNIYLNQKNFNFRIPLKKGKTILPAHISKRDNLPSQKIREDHYFCLNDNRSLVTDSRVWGSFPKESIEGIVKYW